VIGDGAVDGATRGIHSSCIDEATCGGIDGASGLRQRPAIGEAIGGCRPVSSVAQARRVVCIAGPGRASLVVDGGAGDVAQEVAGPDAPAVVVDDAGRGTVVGIAGVVARVVHQRKIGQGIVDRATDVDCDRAGTAVGDTA